MNYLATTSRGVVDSVSLLAGVQINILEINILYFCLLAWLVQCIQSSGVVSSFKVARRRNVKFEVARNNRYWSIAYQPPQVWFSGKTIWASQHPRMCLHSVEHSQRKVSQSSTRTCTQGCKHKMYLIHPVILDTKFSSKAFGVI